MVTLSGAATLTSNVAMCTVQQAQYDRLLNIYIQVSL